MGGAESPFCQHCGVVVKVETLRCSIRVRVPRGVLARPRRGRACGSLWMGIPLGKQGYAKFNYQLFITLNEIG
ncbi:unnamed protein product [Protopolystoma xenopodis]|uniref:Uncharacterized protein n=1 Tax=Protopolystoma xenopodis TaxID=117903 RepID=A0A448WCH9_9PLAT|nr:unnamed protein product [Protopolystoma xenopodis]